MIYLNTRFLRIEWDDALSCVCTEWKDAYADGVEYREALEKILDLVIEKQSKRLLGDGRRMKVISVEDQAWVQTSWMPRSAQAGLRYSALLLPKSSLAQLSVNQIMMKYRLKDASNVEVANAYFDNIDAARQWLLNQPK